MTERVVLHVGCPKSGTTYLQRILDRNRDPLARAGVLVLGERQVDRVHAGLAVREDPRLDGLPPRARGAWARMVAEARAWDGHTAVLSYELLSAAGADQAARALADLDGLEVHVVVTARDLGAAVPSAWQERLKFALTTPLEEWTPGPESAPRAEWGWRTLDPAGVAERWGATLAADRVHLVTVPRPGADPALLWRRFAAAAGLAAGDDVAGLDLAVPPANESLGVTAAALLLRVNELVGPPLTTSREQALWLRDLLAHEVLAPLDDEPIGLTDAQYADAAARAERCVARVREAGWAVEGDLDDLRATRRDARTPGQVTAEEVAALAVRAVLALVLRVRAAPVPPEPAAVSPVAVVRGLAARAAARPAEAALDRAHRRIDELERALADRRRLHQRLAAVTDLVAELLLPQDDQRPEVPLEALLRYREESL